MGVFFPISDKGWKEKRKERERRKKRAVEHQLTTSRSSSRGSFLFGYQQRTTLTYFNLSREYQLLTYSLDFSITKPGSKRPVVIYLLWGEEEEEKGGWTIQMATMVINGATNMKIAAQKAASKCGVHSVVRLQKKWGTAIIPTLWFWCEADVDCRRRRWQIHLQPSWWCRRTSREPKTRFPLNFYLMAVLNYSVVLASALFCCLLTTPFEEKPFAFLLYISFEESVNYWVYSRVNNL